MRSDIKLWKAKKDPIHRDELFRAYSGSKLMDGARELVSWLKDNGCFVAIVSAGVDLFVGSIASMLGADDWVANGFIFDEDGYLTDEGNCRLHATGKGEIIEKLCQQHGFEGKEVFQWETQKWTYPCGLKILNLLASTPPGRAQNKLSKMQAYL